MKSAISPEFNFTDRHYNHIRKMVYDKAGISLADSKKSLVYGRLAKRLRLLNLDSFDNYFKVVEQENSQEAMEFFNAITTNLTSFFREEHHFSFLAKILQEKSLEHRSANTFRIWSAGCSIGAEPYSIAITCLDHIPPNFNVEIVATDLDSNVLKTAQDGVYSQEQIKGLSTAQLKNHFLRGKDENKGLFKAKKKLQKMIRFEQLNLMDAWPKQFEFDIIFCRNVLIYFDYETRNKLFFRFYEHLLEGGTLFIGHSETIQDAKSNFKFMGKTTYRKK